VRAPSCNWLGVRLLPIACARRACHSPGQHLSCTGVRHSKTSIDRTNGIAAARDENGYVTPYAACTGYSLPSRYRLRFLYRQLQYFAQCRQIRGTWLCSTQLPEVHARSTHPDTLSDLRNRQAALDASVAKVAAQTWFTRQRSTPQRSGYDSGKPLATIRVHGKTYLERRSSG